MFCDAINDGNVMSVSSSWESICKLENNRLTRSLEELYEEEIMCEIKEKTLSKEELKQIHKKVKERVLKELYKKRFGDDINLAEEELIKNLQEKFKLLRKRNQTYIEESLRSNIEEQYSAKQSEVDTTDPKSVANAIETISELVLSLQKNFSGEGSKATIYEYFHEKLKNLCYGIANEGITKFSQREKFLEEKLKGVQETHAAVKVEYEKKILEHQNTIKSVEKEKVHLQSNCKALEKELKEIEAEKDNIKNANDKLVKELKKTVSQTHNLHEKETEGLNKKIAYLEKENQQKSAEIEKLEALASQNQELQSAQTDEYNKTITNLMKDLSTLKNEHSRLQEVNDELKTEIEKIKEEYSQKEAARKNEATADEVDRAHPLRGSIRRRSAASIELKKQSESSDVQFESERTKYDEKIAFLEKRIVELETSDAALIQTNRNLSTILERSDGRCFELEKKNEQLKGIQKVFKNVSMLCCKTCGNFYNSSVFSSHLENCLKQLEKIESKENKEENKGVASQKKVAPTGTVEEMPKKSRLIPEFKVQPRESREGYPNKGEFKIFIEYLGKDWHIVRTLKEIKTFIEEVAKDHKDWKNSDQLSELLELNIPKEGVFTAKSVEKLCGLIKDALVAVSRDAEIRDSQKFNRFVGLGNVKRESLLPTASRKMVTPISSKHQFRRKINRDESPAGKSLQDSKLSELDENAQEDC